MNKEKNKNNISCDNSSQSHSQVEHSHEQRIEAFDRAFDEGSSFYEVYAAVKEQIEFDCFEKADKPDIENIVLIITEIYKLPPASMVRIAGNNLPAEMVQAIFHRLEHENIEMVRENFARATYTINHKKTYIRTALYNSVFEINAHYENMVNTDNPQFVKNPFGMKKG